MNNTCPECGSEMKYGSFPEELEYKGHTKTIDSEGWWCTKVECGEGIQTGDALLANERAWISFKKEVDSKNSI